MVAGRFLGEFQHSLDTKGRVILPARFRQILGERAVLTTQDDGCLAIWAPDDFDKKADEMKERERSGQEGRNVARAVGGQPPLPFRYRDYGTMAVIGRGSARVASE